MPAEPSRELQRITEFVVTDDHMKLLSRTMIGYDAWTEFGAPEVDPKRPYGNSDVYCDIAEIVGIEPAITDQWGDAVLSDEQQARLLDLHHEMTVVLQILVVNSGVEPGVYVRKDHYSRLWQPAGGHD